MTLTTGNLRDYLSDAFNLNEELAQEFTKTLDQEACPLTDEDLELVVASKFSKEPKVQNSLSHITSDVKSRIRIWRSEFNRGLWNVKPKYRSFRYDANGLAINRHGNPLSPELIKKLLQEFAFNDPRKESYVSPQPKARRENSNR